METINLAELAKIPYLNLSDIRGRTLSCLCFHDGDWKMWVRAGDQIVRIQAWPAESFYFARSAERQSDLCLQTLNFIAQRASFAEVMKPFVGLQDDISNVSASLAKIGFLHANRKSLKDGVELMVITDVEYILSVCRSMFDLLQEIVGHLWKRIELIDRSVRKKPLKDTFAEMIMHAGEQAGAVQISEKFGLPSSMSEVYVRHSTFFLSLRKIRDNIVHRGSQVQTIFTGDRGFLIAGNLRPFSSWKIWREEETEAQNLVPLLPALGVVVYKTLIACDDIFHTLEGAISCPSPLVPGMALY